MLCVVINERCYNRGVYFYGQQWGINWYDRIYDVIDEVSYKPMSLWPGSTVFIKLPQLQTYVWALCVKLCSGCIHRLYKEESCNRTCIILGQYMKLTADPSRSYTIKRALPVAPVVLAIWSVQLPFRPRTCSDHWYLLVHVRLLL